MTEIGYSNKDEAGRKTSSESEGKKQESNNNEEDSKPTVLVQIENTAVKTGSNRLDSGRGGRKVVTGSKRTTSHIVWESDYVITSEWKIETDCKKPKLNGTANQAVVVPTNGQTCIPKRKGKKSSKSLKAMKEAKEELSESKLDNDLENYFIASKKKKAEDNKMEVDEPVVEDVAPSSEIAPSNEEKKSESGETETEKMETDESEKDKEQPVKNKADDKEKWSDKWSDGKKDEEDPLTEEEEQTLLDEGAEKINDEKTEAEIQDCTKSDVPVEEAQEQETPEEPSSEENKSEEPVEEVKPNNDIENTPDVEEKPEEASEETPAAASADSLPSLEVADAITNQPDDDQSDIIPWQRIVKVSIPEEAIGKTQIRQQDLINKIGKKNYGGKVYYEKGQTEAYLLVTESAKDTVAAMTENPGTFSFYLTIT